MTTLVVWPGHGETRPNAAYMGSDSRITWGGAHRRWDAGRKLFSCRNSPDVFGYSGEVLFPSQMLSQLVELIDSGLLFNARSRAAKRHASVLAALQTAYARRHNVPAADFQILHLTRDAEIGFHVWEVSFRAADRSWNDISRSIDSGTPIAIGSGASALSNRILELKIEGELQRHQAVFAALCDILAENLDPISGGAPQLAGLFSAGPAQTFGTVIDGQRYLHGLLVHAVHSGSLQWRSRSFDALDAHSMTLKKVHRGKARARSAAQRPEGAGNPFARD